MCSIISSMRNKNRNKTGKKIIKDVGYYVPIGIAPGEYPKKAVNTNNEARDEAVNNDSADA